MTPTLNAFDIGDTRATVLIIETPVLMRGREGKDGGGKGPLLSEDISLTIATNNDQVLFTPGVLIIDGTRVGDVRIYEDDISQTVISRWGQVVATCQQSLTASVKMPQQTTFPQPR